MDSIIYLQNGGGKIPSLSVLRLIAMLLIISCHYCQFYDNEWAWWLNVGVQVFFILSGFLYGNKKSIERPISWLKRQFIKILVPYYAFLLIAIILYAIYCPQNLSPINVIGSFFCVSTIKGINHLWFVGNILFCYLLTPYLFAIVEYFCAKSIVRLLFIMFSICCILSVVGIYTQAYFRPGNILCYIVGYFIAVLYQHYGTKLLMQSLWLILPLTLCFNAVYIYEKYLLHNQMVGIWVHLTDYSHLFLGLLLTLILMLAFNHIRMTGILKWSDKYSYTVYLVHQLFILSPLTLLDFSDNKIFNWIFALFVIVFSGVLLKSLSAFLERTLICNKTKSA